MNVLIRCIFRVAARARRATAQRGLHLSLHASIIPRILRFDLRVFNRHPFLIIRNAPASSQRHPEPKPHWNHAEKNEANDALENRIGNDCDHDNDVEPSDKNDVHSTSRLELIVCNHRAPRCVADRDCNGSRKIDSPHCQHRATRLHSNKVMVRRSRTS
jgi:hypothetical protein